MIEYILHPGEQIEIKTKNPTLICSGFVLNNTSSDATKHELAFKRKFMEVNDKAKGALIDLELTESDGNRHILQDRIYYGYFRESDEFPSIYIDEVFHKYNNEQRKPSLKTEYPKAYIIDVYTENEIIAED